MPCVDRALTENGVLKQGDHSALIVFAVHALWPPPVPRVDASASHCRISIRATEGTKHRPQTTSALTRLFKCGLMDIGLDANRDANLGDVPRTGANALGHKY